MRDKTPMEYMLDFFSELFGVIFQAGTAIIKKAKETREKRDFLKPETVDGKKIPKGVADEMSKDDMPISRKKWNKMSEKWKVRLSSYGQEQKLWQN